MKPIVGHRVKITYDTKWSGVFRIIEVYDNTVVIDHPVHGRGGFFPDEYELIPLTKLEKALT